MISTPIEVHGVDDVSRRQAASTFEALRLDSQKASSPSTPSRSARGWWMKMTKPLATSTRLRGTRLPARGKYLKKKFHAQKPKLQVHFQIKSNSQGFVVIEHNGRESQTRLYFPNDFYPKGNQSSSRKGVAQSNSTSISTPLIFPVITSVRVKLSMRRSLREYFRVNNGDEVKAVVAITLPETEQALVEAVTTESEKKKARERRRALTFAKAQARVRSVGTSAAGVGYRVTEGVRKRSKTAARDDASYRAARASNLQTNSASLERMKLVVSSSRASTSIPGGDVPPRKTRRGSGSEVSALARGKRLNAADSGNSSLHKTCAKATGLHFRESASARVRASTSIADGGLPVPAVDQTMTQAAAECETGDMIHCIPITPEAKRRADASEAVVKDFGSRESAYETPRRRRADETVAGGRRHEASPTEWVALTPGRASTSLIDGGRPTLKTVAMSNGGEVVASCRASTSTGDGGRPALLFLLPLFYSCHLTQCLRECEKPASGSEGGGPLRYRHGNRRAEMTSEREWKRGRHGLVDDNGVRNDGSGGRIEDSGDVGECGGRRTTFVAGRYGGRGVRRAKLF
ncbi:hypothetical protein R3P38DRAFT_2778379 [Favolaschia claudopus]|uniref:Uncharacterized protein n=1 Tax=Favolaschia claudopus TaxID=2862362 RepID=A0AAW0BKS5_9AGAR